MAVTTDEIKAFIQRLMRRELEAGELADLTTRDLGDINAYLAEYAQSDLATYGGAGALSVSMLRSAPATVARRTYSEEEILAEFGVFD